MWWLPRLMDDMATRFPDSKYCTAYLSQKWLLQYLQSHEKNIMLPPCIAKKKYLLAYTRLLDEMPMSLTCSTHTSCSIISQPSLSSSYFRNLRDLSAVMLSIGFQYSRTNTIMSWVKFQHIMMSWGISLGLGSWSWQNHCHARRAMVVEWMIAKNSCQSCKS